MNAPSLGYRVSAILVALLASPLIALPAGAENLPREHDTGFFLRMSAGMGWASTESDGAGAEPEISGLTGDYNFAVGGLVGRDFALHGTFWGWSGTDMDFENNVVSGEFDDTVNLNVVGAGVTKYFGPPNVYLSGSVGVATLTSGDVNLNTDPGMAFDATVGKEWWVGSKWGLGIAGDMSFHSVPSDDFDDNWSGLGFGLRFSATLN
jgi:hypothetical protein